MLYTRGTHMNSNIAHHVANTQRTGSCIALAALGHSEIRRTRRRVVDAQARASQRRLVSSSTRLRGRAEAVLPLALPVAGLARDRELGLLLELVHRGLLLLHDGPRLVGAVGRLVALRLAREAAVGVAHGTLVVALEGVEVVVVTRLLRVPRVVDGRLGLNAPDVTESRDVSHLRAGRTHLHGRAGDRGHVAGRGDERARDRGKHDVDVS